MSHVILDTTSYARGHVIPPVVQWFIEGWNGYTFDVSPEQVIFANNFLIEPRNEAVQTQAEIIATRIDDMIQEMGGLSEAISKFFDAGWIRECDCDD